MRVSRGKEFYNKYGTYIILIVLVLFFSFADGSILALDGKGFFALGRRGCQSI